MTNEVWWPNASARQNSILRSGTSQISRVNFYPVSPRQHSCLPVESDCCSPEIQLFAIRLQCSWTPSYVLGFGKRPKTLKAMSNLHSTIQRECMRTYLLWRMCKTSLRCVTLASVGVRFTRWGQSSGNYFFLRSISISTSHPITVQNTRWIKR